MLRNRSVLSLNNAFSPSNDYLHIPFHEQSGETFAIEGRLNGVDFTETGTLVGSPADTIWTGAPGFIRPDGTNYCNLNALSNDYDSLLAPGSYSSMLFLVAIDTTETTPGDGVDHCFLAWAHPFVTQGGYRWFVDNQNPVRMKFSYRTSGGASATTKLYDAAFNSGVTHCWVYLDFNQRDNCMIGMGGNIEDADSFTISDRKADDLVALPDNRAISVLAGNTNASTFEAITNADADLRLDLHDLWVVGFDSSLTDAQISEHITRFANAPYEKLDTI